MRTQDNLEALADELEANCGDFYEACRKVGLSPRFVRQWMADDKTVNEAITNAEQIGNMAIQSEAIRRAVKGVDKGIYYMGDQVATEKVYSDSLLSTLLKKSPGTRDKYGDEAAQTNINVNLQNAINVMPRATTYAEWLAMTKDADMPSPDAIDGEYQILLEAPEAYSTAELDALPVELDPTAGLL